MSRRRVHAGDLAKLLDSFSQPLYVLDDSLVLVYLNEACRAWLGDNSTELLGQPCLYHSGEEKSAAAQPLATALCPPPAVLEGHELKAAIRCPSDGEEELRTARFVPLGGSNGYPLCIVAIVDSREAATAIEETRPIESDDARELHRRLQQFHERLRMRGAPVALVGVSPAARRAVAQAELAAASRANVVLVGPAGSGRRRLAEAIHYGAAGGANWPIVPLDCALLDADLLQSTLRAAISAHDEGGTLLLIEVDRLEAEAQTALATALAALRSVWRIIATAASPLDELVPRGHFRGDLAALLSTLVIILPPLLKRRDDLPLISQALLEEHNARGGKQLGGFAPEALDLVCAYSWPGNLAELDQAVAECHKQAAGTQIARDDLPERLRVASHAATRPRRQEEPIQIDEFLARIERELIRRALARSKGNKAKAARLLGLNRPRLYRRMVQLGLIDSESGE